MTSTATPAPNGNTRSYALDRAAAELHDKLAALDIKVPYGKRQIIYRELVVDVREYTPRKDCLRKLRKMIKLAEKDRFNETQAKLL